jgi:hypothetical protein
MLICVLLRVNSHDEKVAMNEVFAHAALIKHKHVVRYYNSWVEKGQVSQIFIISVADPGSGAFLTPGWVKTQDPKAFKQFLGL